MLKALGEGVLTSGGVSRSVLTSEARQGVAC
jgi:hypothetical protein